MAEKLKNWSGVKQINDRFDFKNSRCFSNKQILTIKEPFFPSEFSQEGPKLDLKNSNSVIKNFDVLERNSTLNT